MLTALAWLRWRGKLRRVRTFCLFIGYPRSGHSLVGHLLNNHPNIVIAHELPLQHLLYSCINARAYGWLAPLITAVMRHTMLAGLMARVGQLAESGGKQSNLLTESGHKYPYFGEYRPNKKDVLTLGNKSGGKLGRVAHYRGAEVLEYLRFKRYQSRFLHVVRNPYDVITTMSIRLLASHSHHKLGLDPYKGGRSGNVSMIEGIDKALRAELGDERWPSLMLRFFNKARQRFFAMADGVKKTKELYGEAVLDVHYSKLLQNPRPELERIVAHLQLEADDDYYRQCASLMEPETHSRKLLPELFNEERLSELEKRLAQYPWMADYRYRD